MKKKDFTLVNVHIPYDGEIPKTDLFIPYNKISGHLNELPAKDKKIVLYCRSDRMSTIAAKELANAGYSNLYNLKGGMNAWEAAGYQLIDNQPSNDGSKHAYKKVRDAGKPTAKYAAAIIVERQTGGTTE